MTDPISNRLHSSSPSDLQKLTQASGLKQSMVLVKASNPGLAFTNRSSQNLGSRKNLMSQSCIKKESPDLQSFMREVRQKLNHVSRTLSQHQRELNDFRQKSINTSFFSSSDSFFRNQSLNGQLVRSVRKQIEQDSYKLRSNLYAEIDALKTQFRNEGVKKVELDFKLGKLQSEISDMIQNTSLSQDLHDLKFRLKSETQTLRLVLTQQLNTRIRQIHDTTSKNLLQLTHYVDKIKTTVQNVRQEFKPSFFTSNQKCYSPKLIKYKEVMQKLPSSSHEKIGQELVINETIYYVDKDGYLLDSSFYYLMDKNNRQIQLDNRQITLLNAYNLLR